MLNELSYRLYISNTIIVYSDCTSYAAHLIMLQRALSEINNIKRKSDIATVSYMYYFLLTVITRLAKC